MIPRPFFSVIMPTYNRGDMIQAAIDCVRAQTYAAWELIIVDDGSTDNTAAVVAAVGDPKIAYYYKKNAGPSAARNYGIARSRSDWIIYLDSDDTLTPECLATIHRQLLQNPQTVFALPGVAVTLELYKDGELIESVPQPTAMSATLTVRDIFMRNPNFWYNGLTHHRRVFDEGLVWDEKLQSMEEWDFIMSIGQKYPDGLLLVPAVLYNYRQRFGSDNLISQTTYQTWADAFEYIYQKHRHNSLLEGQTWYPSRVERWSHYQKEYEAGQRPAYHEHYFAR